MSRKILLGIVATIALGFAQAAPAAPATPPALYKHGMVVAANPLAAQAGQEILKAGGDAVDAAVAVQAVLGLVEPQSSGLGGGAFMTYYDARTHKVTAYNGRETAPSAATPAYFLKPDGTPIAFFDAILSGRSTGPPGAVALLGLAHQEHGKLAWSRLFDGPRKLASDGFVISPRLGGYIQSPIPQAHAPDMLRYFTKPDGSRYKTGDVLRNPAYAATLATLADKGARALYEGPIAEHIAARVQQDPGGVLTVADIKAYRAKETDAVCKPYRIWVVCAPPSPSGGVALLEMLGLLARTDIDKRGPADPKAWLQIAEAERLGYADRERYLGDPDFIQEPAAGLLSDGYLDERARLIGDKAGPAPAPGNPPGAPVAGKDATREPGGTSHMVVVDKWGNVVSMTTTVESVFGSGRMVDGFVLNNQLTDFSFVPKDRDGRPAANAVAPGKRPRSAMSPVVVLDRQGRFVAALGSPGGGAIPAYNLKTLVAVLDWKMTMQQAISLPNMIAIGDRFNAEADKFAPGVVAGLAAMGVNVSAGRGENSGLHGVVARGRTLEGGADPRREGVVLTD